MSKKTAPVSGKRCLSDADTPESGTRSSIIKIREKRKEIFMDQVEEIQEAIEEKRQEKTPKQDQDSKSDYPSWLREGPKRPLDYFDLFDDEVRKFKSIITLLLCFNADLDIPPDYGDLGDAFLDYIERIERYINDLHDYLGDYELLLLEKPKPEE